MRATSKPTPKRKTGGGAWTLRQSIVAFITYIAAMSFPLAIPRRVALQQSPPPLRQLPEVYNRPTSLATKNQPTVIRPYFPRLRVGVQSSSVRPFTLDRRTAVPADVNDPCIVRIK